MKTIFKPWGKEEWIELNDFYCYKRIYINEGYKTSLQYHNFKVETNYIISGKAEVWLEDDNGEMIKKIYGPNDFFNVKPTRKHRVIALTDLIMQEVSTPEVDDVFRIDDEFGRDNGKIEGEHKTPSVLITCAGLGTRLKKLTKNINKTLLPINNRAIISHIIDMFPPTHNFVIALGYQGESIIEYCKITYPKHKFTFVTVDKYEGENTGPGYSALMCKEHLQSPFYFIMGDCLIDSPLPHIDGNWLGVQTTDFPEKYSTISIDGVDNVNSLINKSENGFDHAFIGLGGIYDYEIFWNELEKNIKDGELVCAFENATNYPTLKIKKLKWFDTGNLDDLERAREYFKDNPISLKKDTEEITYKEKETFLKFIPNKKILSNKIIRAKHLSDMIPLDFGSTNNFIHYKWNEGKTPYEIDNVNVYTSFLNVLKEKLKTIQPSSESDLELFYQTKTKNRMNLFLEKYGQTYFVSEYEINGVKSKSMKSIVENFDFCKLNKNPFYSAFHGDLHFDNMIYNQTEDKFYYIDWRDSFGESINSGDIYYDLAKIYGGLLIPYDLMKDEDKIQYSEGLYSINYSYPISENLNKFKTIYENWIINNGYDISIVKQITGLIYLNMSPLHDGKFGKMLWFKSIEMLGKHVNK
jgi:NDP-sugar pyrophosphorylase family protein/mannose-6-phosphate isomerase-like protein (cupin superfamily)